MKWIKNNLGELVNICDAQRIFLECYGLDEADKRITCFFVKCQFASDKTEVLFFSNDLKEAKACLKKLTTELT